MRAWRVHELGEPGDVLRLEDVPRPAAAGGQMALRVDAVALNFPDILLCRGQYQERPALPFTPGLEVAATDVETGRRYMAAPGLPNGGLSEWVVVGRGDAFPIPDSLDDVAAAAMLITYQTGYFALQRRAALRPGETLLVHAGAGGVGSAAIQLGVALGARVIATAGGARKTQVCRDLGAELAIDYSSEDFVQAVKDATGGRGADVVFDPVGGEVFQRSTKCVAFEGRILVIGFAGGTMAQAATNHILIKNYSVVGLHWGLYRRVMPEVVPQVHDALMRLHEEGRIRPLVAEVLPFEEAPAALARLATRDTVGKVVIRPHTAGNGAAAEGS